MMKLKKIFTTIIFQLTILSFATSQKLPTTQFISLKVPNDLVIDGQSTEWGEKYQAYNKATDIFYSIANNADNVYLVIHASKQNIMEKILEGGVSFKLSGVNKKENIEVLFPLLPLPLAKGTLIIAGKSLTGKTITNSGEDISKSLDQAAKDKLSNSLLKANKQLLDNLKEIKISGINVSDSIPGVTDTTTYYRTLPLRRHNYKIIPIINKDNINAMIQFDKKGELTYELIIPLQYIKSITKDSERLFYNITIHGRGEDLRPGNTWTYGAIPGGGMDNLDLESPTDFSAEYILIR